MHEQLGMPFPHPRYQALKGVLALDAPQLCSGDAYKSHLRCQVDDSSHIPESVAKKTFPRTLAAETHPGRPLSMQPSPCESLNIQPADRFSAQPDRFAMIDMCDAQLQVEGLNPRSIPLWEQALNRQVIEARCLATKAPGPPAPTCTSREMISLQVPMPAALFVQSSTFPACQFNASTSNPQVHRNHDDPEISPSVKSKSAHEKTSVEDSVTVDQGESLMHVQAVTAMASSDGSEICASIEDNLNASRPTAMAVATAQVETELSNVRCLQHHLMSEVKHAQVRNLQE